MHPSPFLAFAFSVVLAAPVALAYTFNGYDNLFEHELSAEEATTIQAHIFSALFAAIDKRTLNSGVTEEDRKWWSTIQSSDLVKPLKNPQSSSKPQSLQPQRPVKSLLDVPDRPPGQIQQPRLTSHVPTTLEVKSPKPTRAALPPGNIVHQTSFQEDHSSNPLNPRRAPSPMPNQPGLTSPQETHKQPSQPKRNLSPILEKPQTPSSQPERSWKPIRPPTPGDPLQQSETQGRQSPMPPPPQPTAKTTNNKGPANETSKKKSRVSEWWKNKFSRKASKGKTLAQ